jgi:hypothetical protein
MKNKYILLGIIKMLLNKKKSSKYSFTITGINLSHVDEIYKLRARDVNDSKNPPLFTTKLSELNTEKGNPELVSFLDESKKYHSCNISMIDHNTREKVNTHNYNCFWCQYAIETQGIGCPIEYVPSQAVKSYHSEISKDIYTIKENITSNRGSTINDDRINIIKSEYYVTDGTFCSFNCCKSWIDNHKHDRKYDMSNTLLSKMYNKIMGTKYVVITPAPHWRLRQESGGHLDAVSFRESFNKVEYDYHGFFLPTATMYEERIKF